MTYGVVWHLAAIQQFNLLVAVAPVPALVQEAGRWLDYALRRVPKDVGESRVPGWRLWYGDVLGVYYHVNDDLLRVTIGVVGPARRPRRR